MASGLLAAPATAAVKVGDTFAPSVACAGGWSYFQAESPNSQYTAPSSGVITSWSFQASGSPPTTLRLKVGRFAGDPGSITVVGESDAETPSASSLDEFPTRVPVVAGDMIGFFHGPSAMSQSCSELDQMGYTTRSVAGDPPPGTTAPVISVQVNRKLDVSAVLEPDADDDGFGDETQDQCPANAAVQQPPCDRTAPDTTITQRPKEKTRKKAATFAFAGTDARALAGFECSIDGGAYGGCSSPITLRVRRGSHVFSVRAIDQAGNVDGSPATANWKVRRRRHLKKR